VTPQSAAALLPFPAPVAPAQRLTLFALRRMAAFGLNDAHAANAMLCGFGLGYRRPLILLRAFMHELATGSSRAIRIAPCCALRMTEDEAHMLGALSAAYGNGRDAARHLASLTGRTVNNPALSAAMAYGDALSDMGRPLAG
jgi:hypothetical protein